MAKELDFITHWHQLIENCQASSLEFYNSVEKTLEPRSIPQTHWTRVEHKEGGLASANRVYFRTQRGKFAFDICAAPFGTGFFVSWWLTEPPLPFAFLYTLAFLFGVMIAMDIAFGIGMAIGAAVKGYFAGIVFGGCCAVLGVPAFLWLIGSGIRQGTIPGESTVLAMPLIGRIYERIFAPATFYAVDTALMFRDAVHKAVLEVVDSMTANKGLRALTEDERKPIMKHFGASA
jgi:hypothetical protein